MSAYKYRSNTAAVPSHGLLTRGVGLMLVSVSLTQQACAPQTMHSTLTYYLQSKSWRPFLHTQSRHTVSSVPR